MEFPKNQPESYIENEGHRCRKCGRAVSETGWCAHCSRWRQVMLGFLIAILGPVLAFGACVSVGDYWIIMALLIGGPAVGFGLIVWGLVRQK